MKILSCYNSSRSKEGATSSDPSQFNLNRRLNMTFPQFTKPFPKKPTTPKFKDVEGRVFGHWSVVAFASSVQSAFGWGGESLLSCAVTALLWPLLIPAAIIFSLFDYWRAK